MKSPFKSKYYFRIIDAIARYENQAEALKAQKSGMKQSLQPKEYCAIICRIAEAEKKIKLLRGLL